MKFKLWKVIIIFQSGKKYRVYTKDWSMTAVGGMNDRHSYQFDKIFNPAEVPHIDMTRIELMSPIYLGYVRSLLVYLLHFFKLIV